MIVVGGEALVDLVPQESGTHPALAALTPRLGGGPYNVAIALARLDSEVSFLSRVSQDPFGEALLERMVSAGVDSSLVQRGPEPTTLAVVAPGPGGSACYTFHVEGTADRLVTDPGPLPPQTRALSLGTLSLVLEPGAGTYERVLHRESERGVFVALDPNVRSALIADPVAYRQRFERWLPHVDLLKLSTEDACWLDGDHQDDPLPAARRWATTGPAAVVLTSGEDGMSVITRRGMQVDVPGEHSTVVDTIGAGDTVQAALLHWLERNGALSAAAVDGLSEHQWKAALDFAARAAAVTCSRAGAEPPRSTEIGLTELTETRVAYPCGTGTSAS
ncbi:fructokinase [Halopolyspora algeriensis]|uniref:Fructokinase n=1 Tax=Halopolyspora algeriensis TaxID=1500506 RepID=A0A368VIA9_9ACTN|nr:carbohydrate kinase [Halopolyspora algeriensis]RCW40997.1 fructokinase [Halopolyspora algeriensis]TQM53919.1 fructokinase [Halopolyspora algeriensis]